ncbi:MAG: PepSY domain-containing protein [Coprothermobacterota bacterium]|nr:PepSY domain-containing protein [Coprothermobacterota bacterium]
MKIRNIVAVVAIALLLASAIGFSSMKVYAQALQPVTATQVQKAPDTGAEVASPETDTVDEQVGDQNAMDTSADVAGPDTDTIDEQVGDQSGPDTGNEVAGPEEAKSADSADAAPTGTPAIATDAAQKTAESFLNAGAATKVELDDENGALVYSVQFSDGADVKVDAMTGTVLASESDKD